MYPYRYTGTYRYPSRPVVMRPLVLRLKCEPFLFISGARARFGGVLRANPHQSVRSGFSGTLRVRSQCLKPEDLFFSIHCFAANRLTVQVYRYTQSRSVSPFVFRRRRRKCEPFFFSGATVLPGCSTSIGRLLQNQRRRCRSA
jgi:hypothetical protein